jgi:hypothetical protein
MVGRIYFDQAIDQVCDTLSDHAYDYTKTEQGETFLTPFMIADRGGCSFVQKVRNMEDAGAAVGIVIDNSEEDVENVVMSDDGTGAGIRIPSMLISQADGVKLIDYL